MTGRHTAAPSHFQLQVSTNKAAQSTAASDKRAEKASPAPAAVPPSHVQSSKQSPRQVLPLNDRHVVCPALCLLLLSEDLHHRPGGQTDCVIDRLISMYQILIYSSLVG